MAAPLERQYAMHVGKGAWGPTLAITTPTRSCPRMTVASTNQNYLRSGYLGLGLLFSRGGFLTFLSQAGPAEKTLYAVPFYSHKRVQHPPEASYAVVCNLLEAAAWNRPGDAFLLKWGETYTLQYEPEVAGDLVHFRAELHVAAGEDPEAPDSPPTLGPHDGDPLNFYGARGGTRARLAAMLDVLRLGNDSRE